ncbi:MAG: cell division protein ZapA [Alphaproteobacteria bacterium]
MAQLSVKVNGRDYGIACADGEENHVSQLAAYLDSRVKEVVDQVGQVGEMQIMLMTALNIADDLSGAVSALEDIQSAGGATPEAVPAADDGEAAKALDALAARLERIAASLEKP